MSVLPETVGDTKQVSKEIENVEGLNYPSAPPNQNEAGGVAWVDLYSPTGFKISLTERRGTGKEALDSIMSAIQYGEIRYNLSGTKVVQPAPISGPVSMDSIVPTTAPVGGSPEWRRVTSVKHIRSKNQKHMVIVNVEGYPEGAIAFDKVMPAGVDFMQWELFKEYGAPTSMSYARIASEAKGVKVVEFSSSM